MVGIERGWRSRDAKEDGRAAGLRTFGLTGLMGGICGVLTGPLGAQIVGIAFLTFTAAFGAFSWLEAKTKGMASVTTQIAGMLTFLLGALAVLGDITVAIAAAISMTVLLALRTQLHTWLAAITWEEIRAPLILVVMSFLLLPLLPNRAIDPWGAVNLREVWLLAIMMALISFTGHVAVRLFGDRLGIIVTAAAGGVASSTVTTLTFARLGRDQPGAVNLLVAGLFAFGVRGKPADHPTPRLTIAKPLVVGPSVKLSVLIVVVMLAATLVQRIWGDAGVLAVAALSGIAGVDAITLSMARMETPVQLATQAILVAVAVNTASKATMAAWIGGLGVGLRVWLASAAALAAAGAAYAWSG